MRIKKIGTKMILGILSPVVIALIVYIIMSARQGQIIISEQTDEWVGAELAA